MESKEQMQKENQDQMMKQSDKPGDLNLLSKELEEEMARLSLEQSETVSQVTEEVMSTFEETKEEVKPKKKKKKAAHPKTGGPASNLRSRIKEYQALQNKHIKPKVGVVFDEEMLLHKHYREYHPERPERAMAIYLNLVNKGIYKDLIPLDFEAAEDKHLELAHPATHIQRVKDIIYNPKSTQKDLVGLKMNTFRFQNDTYENKHTTRSAFLAAGGAIEGVRAVCQGQVDSSFCIVRPPGHHSSCSSVAGFCFFNNVAVAARYAQKEQGVKKVCIFDWDVHIGDGTSQIFYDDDTVLYMSIHRFDNGIFYPGPAGKHQKAGEGKGRGYNVQFPFNVEKSMKTLIGDSDFIYACENIFFPIIKEFNPDLLIISAGFDSALGDPLGQIGVTPVGYAYMTQSLRLLCQKVVCVLEGGYDLNALSVSSEAVIQTLRIHPHDNEGIEGLLHDLGCVAGTTLEQLRIKSLLHPRESFKTTASKLAKTHVKQWPFLESLITEKIRRKSSAMKSDQSSDDNNSSQFGQNHQQTGKREFRSNSYQVPDPIEELE